MLTSLTAIWGRMFRQRTTKTGEVWKKEQQTSSAANMDDKMIDILYKNYLDI